MDFTDLVTPVAATNRNARHLGVDDGTSNGGGDLLGALDTETAVAVMVTDDDKGLETGALTGTGLFLHGHDFHDFVLEGGAEEVVDDLVLLDWEREEIDLFEGFDFALLDKTAELGDGDPLFFAVVLAATAAATTAVATAVAATESTAEAAAFSSAISSAFSSTGWCVSHGVV